MPDNLSIWVGEDADHLTCIAKGASAVRMIYQDGAEQLKCFLSFPRQQAKCIRMQIDAILLDRGWSMQDLQLFG